MTSWKPAAWPAKPTKRYPIDERCGESRQLLTGPWPSLQLVWAGDIANRRRQPAMAGSRVMGERAADLSETSEVLTGKSRATAVAFCGLLAGGCKRGNVPA